jgi:hypothetical protein
VLGVGSGGSLSRQNAVVEPMGVEPVNQPEDKTIVIWSDLEPLRDANDPRLWAATSYCMPLEVRQRLLGFSDEQSRIDLERCQRRVREAEPPSAPAN